MELPLADLSCRLIGAAAAGALIGVNRDLHNKPIGARTLGLVSLGAAIVSVATVQFADLNEQPDALSRVVQGVIQGIMAGISFIGAGVILRDAQSRTVEGLTTAATVWVTAALGIACGLAAWKIVAVGMLFSLGSHQDLFASAGHGEEGEAPWPLGVAAVTLVVVTVLVALVSEVFVASVQEAASAFGMTQAFVGFIVVSIVGAAAEMASAFSGARKNRLDLSVGIALGSASQIALFVAPVLVLLSYPLGPTPMDLQFWPGAVVMMLIATMTASLVVNSGRSAWFVGVLVMMVYFIFAMTLYLMPPQSA